MMSTIVKSNDSTSSMLASPDISIHRTGMSILPLPVKKIIQKINLFFNSYFILYIKLGQNDHINKMLFLFFCGTTANRQTKRIHSFGGFLFDKPLHDFTC